MKNKKILILVLCILAAIAVFILAAHFIKGAVNDAEAEAQAEQAAAEVQAAQPTVQFAEDPGYHLRDNPTLYEDDDPYDVVTMYLTVREGNASEGTDHTWAEVNDHSAYYYDERGIDRYKVAALLQVGDESGPLPGMLGYGETLPNATVQIRGQTSSRNAQKNYKIKLVDNSKGWRQQRTIALNKHQTESLRFRNKLCFDLLAKIPQTMSLRTQFVHLYVRDMTGSDPDAFQDYGLYTQVEQLNKTALRAHGLDKNGHLYKINFFEFLKYDAVRTVDDPKFDEKAFGEYLEIKGNSDHSKLLRMLDAVNDYSIPVEELMETYFDQENIAYWMAFMLLIGNSDTQSRNMYIYSPLNLERWYILPWDCDGSLLTLESELIAFTDFSDWEKGISNYWGNQLFRRLLMSQDFRDALDEAITDLLDHYLTGTEFHNAIQKYNETVLPYLQRLPDMKNLPLTLEKRQLVVDDLEDQVWKNYEHYQRTLKSPMPFFVGTPVQKGDTLRIEWDTSYDMLNTEVKYHVILARDYNYTDVLFEQDGLVLPYTEAKLTLEPGQYFLHVDATNAEGYNMNCFDIYNTTDGSVYGTFTFFVESDGRIVDYDTVEGAL